MNIKTVAISFSLFILGFSLASYAQDPLPSWNNGPTKMAIMEFVAAVQNENGPEYVKPADRIATFDNDGTLWVEAPIYTQLTFALDRVAELAPQHPGMEDDPALQSDARA